MELLKFRRILTVLFLLALAGCQPVSNYGELSDSVMKGIPTSQYAVSTEGMVVTSNPLATASGVRMLEAGGNAADAAVAAAFTLTVVEPGMSGLGGRMQAIVRSANGDLSGIDASTQAPMTYDPETAPQADYGYPTIGIPGIVAGLTTLLKMHGSMTLDKVMEPAIAYAEHGFELLPRQAALHRRAREQLLEFEGSKMYFIKENDTVTYAAEDLLVQKDLSITLRAIAVKGPDVFYKGKIAERIARDMADHNAAVTLESLANYKAMKSTVLKGDYRGYDVYGLWIPSFGAITIEILQILEYLPLTSFSEAEWASAVYQATKLAYDDRFKQTSMDVGRQLTDKEYARELSEKIYFTNAETGETSRTHEDGDREDYLSWLADPGHTTHLSVADKNGMIVSLTQSLGPVMGSKVATPGLGFLYAATLGGYLGPFKPGQRAASHISPMILTEDNAPFMGIGAAGGSRIISAIIQVVSRVVDRGMDLEEALAAPRVHPLSEGGLIIETHDSLAWNPEDLEFLQANGFIIEKQPEIFRFGRVHAVIFDKSTKKWIGAADPDGEGTAMGPDYKQ